MIPSFNFLSSGQAKTTVLTKPPGGPTITDRTGRYQLGEALYGRANKLQVCRKKVEAVAMLVLPQRDVPGWVGENRVTPESGFGVIWIRGLDAVQAP